MIFALLTDAPPLFGRKFIRYSIRKGDYLALCLAPRSPDQTIPSTDAMPGSRATTATECLSGNFGVSG